MSLRGYIDGVIGDKLIGWALDDDAPTTRLLVCGELDGVVLGTVEASEPRRDLVRAGFGDGSYGFRIAFDPGLLTPGVHPVAATVGGQPLPLAHDWIVRDGHERAIDTVQLATGVPVAGVGSGSSARHPEPIGPSSPAVQQEPSPSDGAGTPRRPAVGDVVTGAAGWVITIPAHTGPRSHAQLDADAAAIEELYAVAASVGSVARAVAVPAKHLLYAEHLAREQRTDPAARWARAIAARLRDSQDASLLDLYEAMQDARAHGRVYPRSGATLTWIGAIHAYRAITKSLADSLDEVQPQPLAAFEFGRLTPVADGHDSNDTEPLLTVRPSAAPAGAPSGLIVHDGTAGRIAELLRINFWRCEVLIADHMAPDSVRAGGADVVVWIREDR